MTDKPYIPALSFKALTPLYDFTLKWIMREATFKSRLVAQAGFEACERALDLGCGTGTLTIMIKKHYPALDVTGLDADPQVLQIAQMKAARENLSIQWDLGLATALPYESSRFNRVVSSLMIHHLTSPNKQLAFKEIFRTLEPGGEFHLIDFGAPHNSWMWLVSRYMSRLEEAADNMKGCLPLWLQEAGFAGVTEAAHFSTVFGPVSLYRAQKP